MESANPTKSQRDPPVRPNGFIPKPSEWLIRIPNGIALGSKPTPFGALPL
jgi:hypothetical protein